MRGTALGLMMFAVVGCGSKDEKSEASPSELEGSWTQSCGTDDASADEPEYDATTAVYKGNTATATIVSYSDSGCTQKLFTFVLSATFTSGESVATPSGAKTLDLTISSLAATLHTDAYVQAFNGEAEGSSKACGGGWSKDLARTLSAADCADTASMKAIFDKSYGIYKIEAGVLYEGDLGDDGSATDGSSAEKRPTSFETRTSSKS